MAEPNKKVNLLVAVIPIAVILLPLGYSLVSGVFARDMPEPLLERPDPKYEKCVRETEYMRFHHWELLREIREQVVRHGVRGEIRIDSCRECHPNRERFCNRCHEAVNLAPDCFGCHYYPETGQTVPDDSHAGKSDPPPLGGDAPHGGSEGVSDA